jgi:hypothetical protein
MLNSCVYPAREQHNLCGYCTLSGARLHSQVRPP